MIERLIGTDTPIQPRSAVHEGVKGNPIKVDEKPATTNQSEQKQPEYFDEKKKEKLEEVVSGLNHFLEPAHTSVRFKLHEKLNEYYVVIVNDNTDEVVKEIPAKKLLDTYAAMAEHLGLLVDRKI
ncbi:flagellar protein FlaG [Bacillus sp. EB600]|uniref:flagellar protein FlaG n=1 Tax=Bacillus sp. EB600 TaxID=2806345 RepID=UPI0021086FB7|nr:flagellar protein FlaG [Bacillus sp. EB600]MCQ6278707.1 flagellar protein FlaG [Bacillus sp. EB600]